MTKGPKELIPILDELGFVVEEELATVLYLLLELFRFHMVGTALYVGPILMNRFFQFP